MYNDFVLEDEILLTKEEITGILKTLLNKNINSKKRSEKVIIVLDMFKFLSKSQVIVNYINVNDKFKQETINKALEFRKEKDLPEVVDICNNYLKLIGYNEDKVKE